MKKVADEKKVADKKKSRCPFQATVINTAQNVITLFFESNMLTSQGTLGNHYSLVFPTQLISESHDSQSGPKTKKRKRQREDLNKTSESSSSERSVCETGHKTTEKRTPVAKARVTSKRPHVQKNLDPLQ